MRLAERPKGGGLPGWTVLVCSPKKAHQLLVGNTSDNCNPGWGGGEDWVLGEKGGSRIHRMNLIIKEGGGQEPPTSAWCAWRHGQCTGLDHL